MPPLMQNATYPLLLTVALCLSGCSPAEKPQKTKTPATPAASQKGYQALTDVPLAVQSQAERFGHDLESAIRQRQLPPLKAAFDTGAIVDGICEGVHANSQKLNQFKSGLERGMRSGVDQIAGIWTKDDVKFKRVVLYRGDLAARFRLLNETSGISIIDLVLRTNRQGKLAIANFCNHALGYDLVDQSRQLTGPMLAELDKTFLERLLDGPAVSQESMLKFAAMNQKLRAGDSAGVIAAYKELPPSLQQTMAATAIYISALQRSDDTASYKAALKEAAVRFKAVNFQFMLVDVYMMDKEYDQAVKCVDIFMGALEKDAALLTLKSILQNAKGDIPAARATLREAFELEPDCAYAHSKGLDVLLAATDFPAVRDSLLFLEKTGRYNFKENLNDKVWVEFKKAPESAPWR
jgi:tetratricopeptide (TPR) repeat protein